MAVFQVGFNADGNKDLAFYSPRERKIIVAVKK